VCSKVGRAFPIGGRTLPSLKRTGANTEIRRIRRWLLDQGTKIPFLGRFAQVKGLKTESLSSRSDPGVPEEFFTGWPAFARGPPDRLYLVIHITMRRTSLLLGSVLGLCAALFPRSSPSGVDAGTAVRLGISELVQNADLVFEGRVRTTRVLVAINGLIETEYLLDVSRTFEGVDRPTRIVRLPGGVLPNGDGLILPGMPRVVEGEDVLLFLTGSSGSGVRMPVGLAQGKFRVETSLAGEKSLSRRQGALTVVDPTTGILNEQVGSEVFDYAEVVAEIHAAVATEGQSK
jgi:hypothetical protein